MLFTCFCVVGVSNAFNLIDGYHGLSGAVAAIILLAIAYVAFQVGDAPIMVCAFAGVGAILGFLIWNYPKGLIFLGDSGAYLIGFWVAELSILLVVRNPDVSKWFPLLLCFYPIFETLFTIYRRVVLRRSNPGIPDAAHLHQVIYKRVVRWAVGSSQINLKNQRNAMTAPYLWILSSAAAIPALLFWKNHIALKGLFTKGIIMSVKDFNLFSTNANLDLNTLTQVQLERLIYDWETTSHISYWKQYPTMKSFNESLLVEKGITENGKVKIKKKYVIGKGMSQEDIKFDKELDELASSIFTIIE
jgi:hypothetical protein